MPSITFRVYCEEELSVVGIDWSYENLDTNKNIKECIFIMFSIEDGKPRNPSVSMSLYFNPHLDQQYNTFWTGDPFVMFSIDCDYVDAEQQQLEKRMCVSVTSGDVDYALFYNKDGKLYNTYRTNRELR